MTHQTEYTLMISVSIYDHKNGGRLEVRHEITIKAGDFLEVAQIIGRFKELADKLQVDSKK